MKRKRLPEIDELYRSLLKEKNKLNSEHFMKTILPRINKLVDIEAVGTWEEIENSERVDTSDLLDNLRNKY